MRWYSGIIVLSVCLILGKTMGESDRCFETQDPGPCRSSYAFWYYDSESGSCQEFIYGGCAGNGNRFKTRRECERECMPKAKSFSTSDDLRAEREIDRCIGFPHPGDCYGHFRMWYFDSYLGQCREFIYSGCGGNDNKFRRKEICEEECEDMRYRDDYY